MKAILIGGLRAAENWRFEHSMGRREIMVVQRYEQLLGIDKLPLIVWLHDCAELRDYEMILQQILAIEGRPHE